MEKKALLERIVDRLDTELSEMKRTTNENIKDVQLQASAMQSRYDTFRIEGSWKTDGLRQRIAEKCRGLYVAQRFVFPLMAEPITVGSLVFTVSNSSSAKYLILPFCGGSLVR